MIIARFPGNLSLKLVEKKQILRYKPVVMTVYQTALWLTTPFQSIVGHHQAARKIAMQSCDVVPSAMHCNLAISTSFVAGQSLEEVRNKSREFALRLLHEKASYNVPYISLIHLQSCVLIEGLGKLEAESVDGIPGKATLIAHAKEKGDKLFILMNYVHHLVRTFLFRRFDSVPAELIAADTVLGNKMPLRPMYLFAMFFEALAAYQFARQVDKDEDKLKWLSKGNLLLGKFRVWSSHSPWNFENKLLLIEAESLDVVGGHEGAERLYLRSILSASEHKFVHEEGVAAELTGLFFHRRGLKQRAYPFLAHAVQCYRKWGANAVAERVQAMVASSFGSGQLQAGNAAALNFAFDGGTSKKRAAQEEGD